jgi:hypothetical protein
VHLKQIAEELGVGYVVADVPPHRPGFGGRFAIRRPFAGQVAEIAKDRGMSKQETLSISLFDLANNRSLTWL